MVTRKAGAPKAEKGETRAVSALKPYDRNARRHTSDQVAAIAAAIEQFGWTIPILVDEEDRILAGHGRWQAAKLLKLKTVPVVVAAGWSEEQKRAYVIADNKLAERSDWDTTLLTEELTSLEDAGFDLSLLGFGEEELSQLFAEPEDGFGAAKGHSTELADTKFTFGEYRFPIERAAFLKWQDELRQAVGLDKAAALAEIKRRLGL